MITDGKGQTDLRELQKLDKVVSRAGRVLFRARTCFPFDLFPDELIIDENQVNLIQKKFFFTEDIGSILISEIKEVTVSTSIVFSSLHIALLRPKSVPLQIDFLWPEDAREARRIIQGLMAVQNENIELSTIETKLLKKRLRSIGRVKA